jgi:hypothetical protein
MPSLHHRQLLTQRKVLQGDFSDTPGQKKKPYQRRHKRKHIDIGGHVRKSKLSSARWDIGETQ